MRRFLVLVAMTAMAAPTTFNGSLGHFTNTGTGVARNLQFVASRHTVTFIPASSPSACSARIEGSIDGTNYFDLSGPQTCTSPVMFHISDKPITSVRAFVITLTGGSVDAQYQGVQ